jgi:hypothetical protein
VCCRVGWKFPVACTCTVVGPGEVDLVFVVIVRVVVASWVGVCGDDVECVYEPTAGPCAVAAFCRVGCALKAARKPPKKGLFVVMSLSATCFSREGCCRSSCMKTLDIGGRGKVYSGCSR